MCSCISECMLSRKREGLLVCGRSGQGTAGRLCTLHLTSSLRPASIHKVLIQGKQITDLALVLRVSPPLPATIIPTVLSEVKSYLLTHTLPWWELKITCQDTNQTNVRERKKGVWKRTDREKEKTWTWTDSWRNIDTEQFHFRRLKLISLLQRKWEWKEDCC